MEVPVTERSDLSGQTVQSSGLRQRDVIVLTIQRESVTIANPRNDREILAGDTLLCFGKMLTLRSLAPPSPPRRRKRKIKPLKHTEVASE
jgi:ribosomal protein S6--L-glutamate ligase